MTILYHEIYSVSSFLYELFIAAKNLAIILNVDKFGVAPFGVANLSQSLFSHMLNDGDSIFGDAAQHILKLAIL